MIKSANTYPLSQIFDIELKVRYVIPKYQREYVWGKQDWENLLNDLLENDPGYFLGSIICVNKVTDALATTPLEIVDGQQRLITICLLYAAVYEKLSHDTINDETLVIEKANLRSKLLLRGAADQPRIELSEINSNLADYRAVLCEIGLVGNARQQPPRLGARRIYRCYRFFKERTSDLDFNQLKDLMYKTNNAQVVKIEVNDYSDAYVLFESLNNRGIPLSPVDLIKNNILSTLEKKQNRGVDEAFEQWKGLVDDLQEYGTQERFLRQFYNAFKYRPEILVEGFSRATRSNLIKIYEKLVTKDVDLILRELVVKSKIYGTLCQPPLDRPYTRGMLDLLHIGATPAYTFLLYLFSELESRPDLLNYSTDLLVKYFVRRNLTDFPSTRDLDPIFIGLVENCRNPRDAVSLESVTTYLTHPDRCSKLEKFDEKLRGNIYEDNADVARFILCKIEDVHQTRETRKDLWKKDEKGKFAWTIEHVFPEGEKIPTEWVAMVANGDIRTAQKVQTEACHKLGNLTLSGYNSQLSNFSFEKKKDRKDEKGDYIGYKNGMYLNRDLQDKQSWTKSDIEQRTERLVREALSLFKIDTEHGG